MRNSLLSCGATLLLLTAGLAATAQLNTPELGTYSYNVQYAPGPNSITGMTVNYNLGTMDKGSEPTWAVPFQLIGPAVPPIGAVNPNGYLEAWCIDIPDPQYSNTGVTYNVQIVPPASTMDPYTTSNELVEASWLLDTYQPGLDTLGSPLDPTSALYETDAAALQVALWDVVAGNTIGTSYNNNVGVSGIINPLNTNFYVTMANGNVVSVADELLNSLGITMASEGNNFFTPNPAASGYLYENTATNNSMAPFHNGQNLMGMGTLSGGSTQNIPPAPEGSTVAMFALGLAPLFGTFWFKRRKQLG